MITVLPSTPTVVFSAAIAVLAGIIPAGVGRAFYNVKVGDPVPNVRLHTTDGGTNTLLGDGVDASVFLFIRPDQEYSRDVVLGLASYLEPLKDRNVHWVLVVSDSYPKESVTALMKEAKLDLPVLIDPSDELYGKLGVVLHPVLGIADKQRKLAAYLPFAKINFWHVVSGQLRFVLGEITEAEFDAYINPPKATQGGNGATAKRNLRMADMMFKSKKFDKALEIAKKSVDLDPTLANAHALVAAILAEQKNCKGATAAAAKALELDAANERAKAAKAACAK